LEDYILSQTVCLQLLNVFCVGESYLSSQENGKIHGPALDIELWKSKRLRQIYHIMWLSFF